MAYFAAMKIVRTTRYLKDMKRLGASASDIADLELGIVNNPMAGDIIPGLGGIRKIRFGLKGKGKRGGGRAIYFLQVSEDLVFMLFAYAKNMQTDLTPDQKKIALSWVKELKDDDKR